jgi:hypothetical protein
MPRRLLCADPAAEQHCLLGERQWWIPTFINCPPKRHCDKERLRIIGHAFQSLQRYVKSRTSHLDLAATECENTGKMLHRRGHRRVSRGDAECLIALTLRQVPLTCHKRQQGSLVVAEGPLSRLSVLDQ